MALKQRGGGGGEGEGDAGLLLFILRRCSCGIWFGSDATTNSWGRDDINNLSVWRGAWKRRQRRRRRNNQPSSPHPSRGMRDDPQLTPRSGRVRNNTTINRWLYCETNNLHARARRRRRRRHPSPPLSSMLQSRQQKTPGRRTWRRRTTARYWSIMTTRRRRRT